MSTDVEENVLACVQCMLRMPAVEYMTVGDLTRAVSMIEASHPRPANGRIEGTAMWLTALCARYACRCVDAPTERYVEMQQEFLRSVRDAARTLPATREQVTKAARELENRTTYEKIVQLGGSSLALAVEAASSRLIAFSEKDRAECARRHREENPA